MGTVIVEGDVDRIIFEMVAPGVLFLGRVVPTGIPLQTWLKMVFTEVRGCKRRQLVMLEDKAVQHLLQIFSLAVELGSCGGGLFHAGGILLGHIVNLCYPDTYLVDRFGLFGTCNGYLCH